MSQNNDYNEKIITSAREAWNTLSEIMEEKPITYNDDTTFMLFYRVLCEELFTKETEGK